MWTRPRRERNDLTFAKFVTTCLFSHIFAILGSRAQFIDFHHRRAARHHTHTYMLHAPCKCVLALQLLILGSQTEAVSPHTHTP